jgi:hypothetical protein
MSHSHLTQTEIIAYLDNRASDENRRLLEAHLSTCSHCANRLTEAQRLARELGPTLKSAYGQPTLPSKLYHQVRSKLQQEVTHSARPIPFVWMSLEYLFNATGTLAIIALLAFSIWVIVKPLRTSEVPITSPTEKSKAIVANPTATNTVTSTPPPQANSTPSLNTPSTKSFENVGDALRGTEKGKNRPTSTATPTPQIALPVPSAIQTSPGWPLPTEGVSGITPTTTLKTLTPISPEGLIAFSFFNPAPQRQTYEIHLIKPDGTAHRIFPLDGVSEPALRQDNLQLAYRAWGEPTSHRSLLSGSLDGRAIHEIGGFWEDAQPDWSPTEDRLIYASQRESDRHWRLYTSRGDGQDEVALPLEGKSPSFAPDGKHFAYVGCDLTGNRCGLWQANLDNARASAQPILENHQASSPDWSPKSNQIAYMANVNGNWDLYLVGADGTNVRRLTTDPVVDGLPAWSPDGEWLAFLSNRGGNWGIWRLHLSSGQMSQIFAFDGGVFTPPHYGPYGERNWWDEQLSWGR